MNNVQFRENMPNPSFLPTHSATQNSLPVLPAASRAAYVAFAAGLDLTAIKYKLVKEKDWTLVRANTVEPQYKAFLFLIGSRAEGEFVPTFDIDEMWHSHILDTRKYMADCARHFGFYVHHYPYLGMKDAEDQIQADRFFAATRAAIGDGLGISIGQDLAHCGSACGGSSCGGHSSCGSHSSCSSHSSCGHSSGHNDAPSHTPSHTPTHTPSHTPTSIVPTAIVPSCTSPLISSCSTGSDKSERKRKPERPAEQPARPSKDKRNIIQRIFDLSSGHDDSAWYLSVTPELFAADEYRPDAVALKLLDGGQIVH